MTVNVKNFASASVIPVGVAGPDQPNTLYLVSGVAELDWSEFNPTQPEEVWPPTWIKDQLKFVIPGNGVTTAVETGGIALEMTTFVSGMISVFPLIISAWSGVPIDVSEENGTAQPILDSAATFGYLSQIGFGVDAASVAYVPMGVEVGIEVTAALSLGVNPVTGYISGFTPADTEEPAGLLYARAGSLSTIWKVGYMGQILGQNLVDLGSPRPSRG